MQCFSVIDHMLISKALAESCFVKCFVKHECDNTSDHDPIFLALQLNISYIGASRSVHVPRLSCAKAPEANLSLYRHTLTHNLQDVVLPVHMLSCQHLSCRNVDHAKALHEYAQSLVAACVNAWNDCIPVTSAPRTSEPQIDCVGGQSTWSRLGTSHFSGIISGRSVGGHGVG